MSNIPSDAQLERLLEFLKQNPDAAKGFPRINQGKLLLKTKRKWASLSTSLNALGGTVKNGQGWAEYWSEKKNALKLRAQLLTLEDQTGVGSGPEESSLSALDNSFIAIINEQDAYTRDVSVTSNPLRRGFITRTKIRRYSRCSTCKSWKMFMEWFLEYQERRLKSDIIRAEALTQMTASMGSLTASLTNLSSAITNITSSITNAPYNIN